MHLHYDEAGTGAGTPVVMLHGGGPGASGMSNFKNNLPVFAEHFRTFVVDQPGYGKSDKPPVTGNYFTFAADGAEKPARRARHPDRSTWSATPWAGAPRSASRSRTPNAPAASS